MTASFSFDINIGPMGFIDFIHCLAQVSLRNSLYQMIVIAHKVPYDPYKIAVEPFS